MTSINRRVAVTKAVIPVAGLGTRFLPATKAQPKEMLPVVDKPVIQYIVEEAVAAGIKEIIFVTAIGKRAIEDHFDRNFELEYRLEQKQKKEELAALERIGKLANFAFVRQQKPLGDGHALLSAAPFIGDDESVAVLFGDDIIASDIPAIGQLMDVFRKYNDPVVAIQEVPEDEVSRYGVIQGTNIEKNTWEVQRFVEKPKKEEAPSNLAAVGRYIITPEIMERLAETKPGKDGEVRLADAFAGHLANGQPLYGCKFEGRRYDCGSKLGYVEATVDFALKHPEVNGEFKKYLKELEI